jgi:hypothetical protein
MWCLQENNSTYSKGPDAKFWLYCNRLHRSDGSHIVAWYSITIIGLPRKNPFLLQGNAVEVRLCCFFLVSWGGVRLSPFGTSGNIWPIVPAPDDRWWWVLSSRWNENWQGKPKYSEETCSSATNPTWPDLESNPGRRDGKPATNRVSCGTAFTRILLRVRESSDRCECCFFLSQSGMEVGQCSQHIHSYWREWWMDRIITGRQQRDQKGRAEDT